MNAAPSPSDIAIRLALTVIAGALIGVNRSERGRPAGLRTTLLVCLAASVTMIQVNILLHLAGRTHDSFVMLDLMRLPLGILTGMGFIGGGVILRRGDLVVGVTTAATLWLTTVVGLCLGAGQLALGMVTAGLMLLVLAGLHGVESFMRHDRRGTLVITAGTGAPDDDELYAELLRAGYRVETWDVVRRAARAGRDVHHTVRCVLCWHGRMADVRPPAVLTSLSRRPGILTVRWHT